MEASQCRLSDKLNRMDETLWKMRTTDRLAELHHPAAFGKYKGIHQGQDIVVVGAGPTLNAYTPIPGAIHIGVNRTYLCEKLTLDYLFVQDGGPIIEVPELTNYRRGKCKRFFGVHPHSAVSPITETFAEANEANRYYFLNSDPLTTELPLPLDMAHQPLVSACSIAEPAFQFALWCRPRRIYIVGCDCSDSGYFAADQNLKQKLAVDGAKLQWQRMADFAKRHYPEVEIISVNPVGLKGMFKDMDMKAKK